MSLPQAQRRTLRDDSFPPSAAENLVMAAALADAGETIPRTPPANLSVKWICSLLYKVQVSKRHHGTSVISAFRASRAFEVRAPTSTLDREVGGIPLPAAGDHRCERAVTDRPFL